MYKRIYFTAFLLLIALFVNAQPAGYTIVSNTDFLKQKVNDIARQTKTIKAEFIQEKNLAFLYDKILSRGILFFESPDKLRLEYTEPFYYLLIMNNGEMMIKSNNSETRIDLRSSTVFDEINNLIISSINGEILNMPGMTSSVYENDEHYFINLQSGNEELKKYISSIELYITKKDYTVAIFKVFENSEDYTLIEFVNRTINEEIPVERFTTQ